VNILVGSYIYINIGSYYNYYLNIQIIKIDFTILILVKSIYIMIRHFLQLVAQLGTIRYKCSSSHPMVQLAVQPCGVHVPVRDCFSTLPYLYLPRTNQNLDCELLSPWRVPRSGMVPRCVTRGRRPRSRRPHTSKMSARYQTSDGT
jgi:hypothetical protein